MSALVVSLDDSAAADTRQVGGKAAGLARLIALGVPVPPGIVVTTEAYRTALAANGLADAPPARLREALPAATLPPELDAAIRSALAGLDAESLAVRSSATSEDLAEASFAGQHDTLLGIRSEEAVLHAVRTCWASLWSPRAVDYREQRGWTGEVAMAVVVQTMVAADWAGVLFTADPVTGDPQRMAIETVRGLGESLVSGEVTGQRVVVDKATLHVVDGVTEVPDALITQVAGLGRQVEDAFGVAQDIEWAASSDRVFLVQARPMTALLSPPRARRGAARFGPLQRAMAPNVREHVPVAPYPFDLSIFFRPLWEHLWAALPRLGLHTPPIDRVFVEIGDGVIQVVPPKVRPTPHILTLPMVLLRALRTDPDAWLEQARQLAADARRLEDAAPDAASDADLLARIRELSARQVALAPGRFAAFPGGMLASAVLGFAVSRAVRRGEAARVESELLAGVASVTSAANRELRLIADTVRGDQNVRDLFAAKSPGEIIEELPGISGGKAIAARVDAYLSRYGNRETRLPSAAFPAWRDEPSLVYGLLKALVAGAIERTDDGAERAREARLEIERRLAHGWLGLKGVFLRPLLARSLPAARAFVAYRENSHYLLFAPFATIRRLALELGRRLAERGELDAADDIFFLQLDELEARHPAGELHETARRRHEARRALEGRETTVPVDLLTVAGPELRGRPVSAGRAVGPARIIRTEREFGRLSAGEILVAPYTNPTWTPLFAIAAGVVVEAGGAASHAAIVAREYGLPGVMGVAGATARLHDGERLIVDGDHGTVAVLDAAAMT